MPKDDDAMTPSALAGIRERLFPEANRLRAELGRGPRISPALF